MANRSLTHLVVYGDREHFANLAYLTGFDPNAKIKGGYGKLTECTKGKDTVAGHWEMMGIQLEKPFAVFMALNHFTVLKIPTCPAFHQYVPVPPLYYMGRGVHHLASFRAIPFRAGREALDAGF